MRIALLIIILSKEKAGGSGFICLSVSLPSLACKALANILATQYKEPMPVLMSDVKHLSLVVVTGQHLMLGILQTCLLCPQNAVLSCQGTGLHSLMGNQTTGAANMSTHSSSIQPAGVCCTH